MDTTHYALYLQKHPIIGATLGFGGGLTYWIEVLHPIISFIAVVLGTGIAAITLYLKYLDLKSKLKK